MAISLAYASPLARGFKRANSTAPAVNVKESEKAYTMELPAKACVGINTAITSITTITIVIFFLYCSPYSEPLFSHPSSH